MTKTKFDSISYRKFSDLELIQRFVQTGDYAAFFPILERYQHLIWGLCYTHTKDIALANEKMESIVIQLVEDLKDQEIPHFKAFLLAFVSHQLQQPADVQMPLPQAITLAPFSHPALYRELELHEIDNVEDRKYLNWFYNQQWSIRTIAGKTKRSVQSIIEALYAAKQKLKMQWV